jgi:hypothetical protein
MRIYSANCLTVTGKALYSRLKLRAFCVLAPLFALLFASASAQAGTFLTPTINGNLSEWGSVPVAFTGNGNTPNISKIQLANDSNYFYLAITFTSPVNLHFSAGGASVYLAFDTDSNPATGFNVFGLTPPQVGSELGYANDFPFQQASGNFNSGSVTNGTGIVAPYNATGVSTMEIGIPLGSTYASNGQPTFPNASFILALYTQNLPGSDNFTGAIPYTLAVEAVPEPSTWVAALLSAGVVGWSQHRRLRKSRRVASIAA